MKIIDQSHEILSCPDNILEQIETAGRTCYKSEGRIGCALPPGVPCSADTGLPADRCRNVSCMDHSAQVFAKRLIKRGHHAMIEFGDITVRFITNRGVTHELCRHRLFSLAQESTRYVRYNGGMEFIRPVWCSEDLTGMSWNVYIPRGVGNLLTGNELRWLDSCYQSELAYQGLLNDGWRPEQAREVLPNSLKTEIVVKGNIREWRHMLKLRCSKKAHPQMRALMLPLLDELKDRVPVVFDDLEIN